MGGSDLFNGRRGSMTRKWQEFILSGAEFRLFRTDLNGFRKFCEFLNELRVFAYKTSLNWFVERFQ